MVLHQSIEAHHTLKFGFYLALVSGFSTLSKSGDGWFKQVGLNKWNRPSKGIRGKEVT